MSEYLYLYRRSQEAMTARSPQRVQQMMQKWTAWMKDLEERGHLKDRGLPLEPAGKVVKGREIVTDGPFAETKDIVGGYTLVEARDLEEAAEIAKGCPVFEIGGMVEVRPVMKMNM